MPYIPDMPHRRTGKATGAGRISFREVFEKKPNGSAVFKVVSDRRRTPVDGVFLTVNAAFEAITGRDKSSVVGRRASEVFPGWKPPWREVFERAAAGDEAVQTEGHDATIGRYLTVTAFNLQRNTCAVTVSDVTDDKWAGEAVAADRKRLKFILENTRDIVYAAAADGTITYVSPQIATLGLDAAVVVGTNIFDYIHPEDAAPVREILGKAFETGWDAPICLRLVGAGGKVVPFEEWGKVHRSNGNVVGVTGVLRDVTDRERLDAERDALARELAASLAELKLLRGLVPICARCGAPRADSVFNAAVRRYLDENPDAALKDCLCPACLDASKDPPR